MELGWLIIALCTLCAFGLLILLVSKGYLPDLVVHHERAVGTHPTSTRTTQGQLIGEGVYLIWTTTNLRLQRLVRGTLLTVIPHQNTLTFEFFCEEKMVAKVTIVQNFGNAAFFRVWIDPKFVTLTQSEYALTEAGKMNEVLRRLVQNPAFREKEEEFKLSGPRALTSLYFGKLYEGEYDEIV